MPGNRHSYRDLLSGNDKGFDFLFGEIVIKFQSPIRQELTESLPMFQGIAKRFHWFDDRRREMSVFTVKELSQALERYSDKWKNNEAWPKTYRKFGDELRRVAPALRQVGIECRSLSRQGGYVKYQIRVLDDDAGVGRT